MKDDTPCTANGDGAYLGQCQPAQQSQAFPDYALEIQRLPTPRITRMSNTTLLHELIAHSANRSPSGTALSYASSSISYDELLDQVTRFSSGLMHLGTQRGERVAIYLEKRFETVIASFGAPAAGGVFVPLNPLLKPTSKPMRLASSKKYLAF